MRLPRYKKRGQADAGQGHDRADDGDHQVRTFAGMRRRSGCMSRLRRIGQRRRVDEEA